MIERICPKCRVPMNGEKCIKPNCGCNTELSSTIYWCDDCNIPIFDKSCLSSRVWGIEIPIKMKTHKCNSGPKADTVKHEWILLCNYEPSHIYKRREWKIQGTERKFLQDIK